LLTDTVTDDEENRLGKIMRYTTRSSKKRRDKRERKERLGFKSS
jgi:hypothetical protein